MIPASVSLSASLISFRPPTHSRRRGNSRIEVPSKYSSKSDRRDGPGPEKSWTLNVGKVVEGWLIVPKFETELTELYLNQSWVRLSHWSESEDN